ncbi:hypothetical protein [Maridesulfovibrio sp.]|uniref:hypothetical protein n=1 Tax=Maridesulfovibrio sp. TaxID=2795000 RepID=UPI002AA8E407|nr:hypothetical protein [Maridesulfovibrio sp.]
MHYVHVESPKPAKQIDYSEASATQSERVLFSLIHALGRKEFDFTSTPGFAQKLKSYRKQMNIGALKLYVDSGGYSMITGDVPFEKTTDFIDCYNRFFEYHNDSFDYIFSLDIPIWGGEKNTRHLTKKNLKRFNEKSIQDSLSVIKKNPVLADKWFFVWHFKFQSQFDIWSDIFMSQNVSQYTSNYAIGGQVGLRKMAEEATGKKLNFTPFTAMAFLCLAEHLSGPLTHKQFKLHVLGIYNIIDRFQLILIDKLFSSFLSEHNLPTPEITHDTINYTRSGLYDARKLKPYSFNGQSLDRYENIFKIPDSLLRKIYFNEILYNSFISERDRQKEFKEFDDVSFIVPLSVYSNLEQDRFLEHIEKQYNLCNGLSGLDINRVTSVILQDHPDYFSISQKDEIINNLSALQHCMKLLRNGDIEGLKVMVKHYIKMLSLDDPF